MCSGPLFPLHVHVHVHLHVDLNLVFVSSQIRQRICFPDRRLVQYDSGKLQVLAGLLRSRKQGGHKCLIFTQVGMEGASKYHPSMLLFVAVSLQPRSLHSAGRAWRTLKTQAGDNVAGCWDDCPPEGAELSWKTLGPEGEATIGDVCFVVFTLLYSRHSGVEVESHIMENPVSLATRLRLFPAL